VAWRNVEGKFRAESAGGGRLFDRKIGAQSPRCGGSDGGKDTKKLDQILADDFVYRNPIEGERSRAEFLAIIDSLPVKIVSVWSEDMKVNVYGDVAVMTGTQKAKIQNEEGKEEISATAFVDVFVKRQGKWKLVLAYSMDLPAEK
jgi:ketosteroid isomerase-like protein